MNGRTNSTDSRANDLQIPLDAPATLVAIAGNAQVSLSWTDPLDMYATPEGATAQDSQQLVAKWSHTLVVRNIDHQPENPDDGTIILMSSVRNQYQTNGYVDNTVENGTPYHYGVFAISTANVASAGSFTSATPIAGTPLSDLAEGTLIKIQENGSPVEFYLAKHNYEEGLNGAGRELVVRKGNSNQIQWTQDGNLTYNGSSIDIYFNGSYLSMFSVNVQNMMGNTKFYANTYVKGNEILERKVFTPSMSEYGLQFDGGFDVEKDGTQISLLSTSSVRTTGNAYYTRSFGYTTVATNQWRVNLIGIILSNGRHGSSYPGSSNYTRPCFTLPSTALVDSNLNLIEGVA